MQKYFLFNGSWDDGNLAGFPKRASHVSFLVKDFAIKSNQWLVDRPSNLNVLERPMPVKILPLKGVSLDIPSFMGCLVGRPKSFHSKALV